MKIKLTFLLLISYLLLIEAATAQSVGINNSGTFPDASAMLDVASTTKGMLVPRMDKAQKNAIIAPATGLLIFQYNPDSIGFHYYNGTAWIWLANAAANTSWSINGNGGTDSAVHFLGTTDTKPLMLRQNNQWLGQLNSSTHNYYIGAWAGISNSTGTLNTAYGDSALQKGESVINSTAIGANALANKKEGPSATAVGVFSLATDSSAFGNTGLGVSSLRFNKVSDQNVAVGFLAGRNITGSGTSGFNVYVGAQAGTGVLGSSTATRNVGLGYHALFIHTTGSRNVATGADALLTNSTGTLNVATGDEALRENTTGSGNLGFGGGALFSNQQSNENIAIGNGAGYFVIGSGPAGANIYIGAAAGVGSSGNSTGVRNAAIGYRIMNVNTSGNDNAALGTEALLTNTTGSNNIAVGRRAGDGNTTGSNNSYLGMEATSTDGLTNATAIGYKAFAGQNNSLVLGSINGVNGATTNTNVGIGTSTPNAPLQFSNDVVSRKIVLWQVPVNDNQFFGFGINPGALRYQVDAIFADHVFYAATSASASNELMRIRGNGKVGIATAAPDSSFSVANNFMVGSNGSVQFDNSVPTMMTMFRSGTSNANRMVIAHSPALSTTGLEYQDATDRFNFKYTGTDRMSIDLLNGFTGINRTPVPGLSTGALQIQSVSSGIDPLGIYNSLTGNNWSYWVNSGSNNLDIFYNGIQRGSWSSVNGVYTSFSDSRLKKDIQPMSNVLASINKIQPYLFHYKDNAATDPLTVGFMAQDLQPLFPEAVKEMVNKDGSVNLGIQYQYLAVYAIKAIQEQQQLIDAQNKKIESLEKRLEKLESKQ